MNKLKVYNLNGEVIGEQELNPEVFGVEVKPVVVQQIVVAQQATSRKPWAHTKERGEVRGGGRKPWRQKGTGRARHGSTRSPIWRGGAVTFGPRSERNFVKHVNKKMKQAALRMVLSDKVANEQIILVDSLALPEVKTKQIVAALGKLPLKGRKSLFVLQGDTKNLSLSSRNIQNVATLGAQSLNVVDLLNAQNIIVPVQALSTINELYSPKKK